MTIVSLKRCYELQQQYEKALNFEHRKLVEIAIQDPSHLNQPNNVLLLMDRLAVLEQTIGKKAVGIYTQLRCELDLQRAEILGGSTTGDVAQDVLFCMYGLDQNVQVKAKVHSLVGYLREYQDQHIAVFHHYHDREEDEDLMGSGFIDFSLSKVEKGLHVRRSPLTVSIDGQGLIDPDEKRPECTLFLGGKTYHQHLITQKPRKFDFVDGIDLDPRLFDHLNYTHGLLVAEVSSLHIPYVSLPQVLNGVEPFYFLSKVEIIAGNAPVKEAVQHYLRKRVRLEDFLDDELVT